MSTYSNNNIDGMAVGLLLAYVNSSSLLEGNFNYNDKELLWDGDIKIFSDIKIHSINTFVDRIPVQIKGHEVTRYKGNNCKYPIYLKNLQKYQQDGGVIYFEIELKNNTNYRLYYKILLPVSIKNYLNSAKGKDSITIKFKKLNNNDSSQIKTICNFFIKERKKQVGKTILDIEKLKDIKDIDKITIDVLSNNSTPNFWDDEKFIYTEINGELQPLAFPNDITISHPIQNDVSVNGKIYFNEYTLTQSSDDVMVLEFGKCISITAKKVKKRFTINFNLNNVSIQQVIDEEEFISAFLDYKTIEVNKVQLININSYEFDKFINNIRNLIEEIKTIAKVLNHLGVDLNIPCLSLTQNQIMAIKKLNKIIYGNTKGDDIGFKSINIGEKKAIFLFATNDQKEQKCYNVFSNNLFESFSFFTSIEGIGKFPTSPYFILGAEAMATSSNFKPEPVINNILSIQFHSEIVPIAIDFLLDLLIEYDKTNDKRLLEVAEAFYKNDSIMNSGISMIINKYQILKRMHNLSIDEKEEIIQLKNRNQEKYDFVCCANLLIDNIAEFEYYFKKLNKEEQEKFTKYPIIKFYSNDISKLIEQ